MNTLIRTASTMLVALVALPAWANPAGAGLAWADVIQAVPVRQQVRIPVEERNCWDEEVYHEVAARRSATPRIFGAILGGVIGNQFGGGSGRDLMTVAGAALGSSVAADQQRKQNPDRYYATTQRRCSTGTRWQTEERIIGWDVTYEYQGEVYQARLQDAPGDRIRIRVAVTPVVDG
jgi:uncharacterized protein YcfJ